MYSPAFVVSQLLVNYFSFVVVLSCFLLSLFLSILIALFAKQRVQTYKYTITC